jgi:putative transposase
MANAIGEVGRQFNINRAIRERLRLRLKRNPQPSAAIVDSQSVKTTGAGGEERAYHGDKKVKGCKRHILVDTEGFVLKVKVHSAKTMDYEGIKTLLEHTGEQFPRLSHLWLDGGYRSEDTRARTGWRRPWSGQWISSNVRDSPLLKRCSRCGPQT